MTDDWHKVKRNFYNRPVVQKSQGMKRNRSATAWHYVCGLFPYRFRRTCERAERCHARGI